MKAICAGLTMTLFWWGPAAGQDQTDPWRNYTNERYGFSLVVPSHVLAVEKKSDAGDGLVFAIGLILKGVRTRPPNAVGIGFFLVKQYPLIRAIRADDENLVGGIGENPFFVGRERTLQALAAQGNGGVFVTAAIFRLNRP